MCETTPVHVAPVAQNVANMCRKNHSKVAITNTQKYVNSFVGCTKYEIYEQTTWNLTPYKSDQLTLQLKLYFMFDTTMPTACNTITWHFQMEFDKNAVMNINLFLMW